MSGAGVDCGDYLLIEVERYRCLKISVFGADGTQKHSAGDGSVGTANPHFTSTGYPGNLHML